MNLNSSKKAKLARDRLPELKKLMAACRLCPRECEAKRFAGEFGECGLGPELRVMSSHLHPGEEPAVSGTRGSGTVFFSGCNLACLFCQNYDISHEQLGRETTPGELGRRMVDLQELGAHNINLVTPTPQNAMIVEALVFAWENGLNIPVVYNCGGYESLETLHLLDGLIDVYMPDLKYGRDELGTVSGVDDYTTRATAALKEMWRQVGSLVTDKEGIAMRGLIVRHLVLPNDRSGTEEVLRWLARELGPEVTVSLMSQFHPLYRAGEVDGLNRRLTNEEYWKAANLLEELGLEHGWVQQDPGG
ncbi:MAG: radical SAM protein [bacterium]